MKIYHDFKCASPHLGDESSPVKWLIVCAIICLFGVHTFAQTQTENQNPSPQPGAQADEPSDWQWSFSIRNRTGFRTDEPRVFQMSRTIFDTKGIYKINGEWRMTLEGRAHYDPVERLGYPKYVWLDPRQMLLDGKVKKVDLKLGLQQVVWGQADGLRVLDVINPLDYREFILEDFIDSRRPLWLARADAPVGNGALQLIWVPYFAPGRLPAADDEFGLGESFGLGLIGSAASKSNPPQFPFRVKKTERPAYQLKSSQFGARYSRSVGKWDLTANYFYGWEDLPTNNLDGVENAVGGAAPTLVFKPRYDRKEVFGGTAATNFGSVVMRLEAGWNRNKATPVSTNTLTGFEKRGQFSSVAGLDWSAKTWLWVSGQYFLSFTSAPQDRLSLPRYNHLASIYFRTNFLRETFRPELFVLTGLNPSAGGQYLIRPRIAKTLGDHWSVGAGADFLGGKRTNVFGYFDSRDRVVIELKWLK
ncbi:MAG TPA: DUF1302 family protein [Blastocatellia bacterium]|nr:DUF1302 family protein [Blastocatellia bacterium]